MGKAGERRRTDAVVAVVDRGVRDGDLRGAVDVPSICGYMSCSDHACWAGVVGIPVFLAGALE